MLVLSGYAIGCAHHFYRFRINLRESFANKKREMVPVEGIEPPTFSLQNCCSTAELNRHALRMLANPYRRYKKGAWGVKPTRLPVKAITTSYADGS